MTDTIQGGLGWEAWFTLAVVIATVYVLARDLVAPAIAVIGADIVLLVSGVIDTGEALAGFSNPAPVTVAALFVIARGVDKTGAMQPLVRATLGRGFGGRVGLLRLLAPAAGASAFLNNTPIVAMLSPQVADWADKHGQAASKYLMPLSFATILGGTLTVMGTSTNLVVSGLLETEGHEAIGMFELTKVGLPVAIVGLLTIVLLAPKVLPDRRTARQQFSEDIREFVCSARVAQGGILDGVSVEEGGLRHLQGVFLVEIVRDGEMIAPATPETVLRGGDQLTFAGRVDMVRDIQNMRGLVSTELPHSMDYSSPQHTFFEVVVSGASALVGKTLKEAEFRSRYQAAVLAIHRAGSRVNEKLGAIRLKEGDTLLVVSDLDFGKRWRDRSDFLLVSRLGGSPPPSSRQALLVGALTLAVVVVAGAGFMPILHAALLGAVLLVLTRVLTPNEARSAVDLDVLVVIAASFGLGAAIETSGLAEFIGRGIIESFSGWGPIGVLIAITFATVVVTEIITNNAAAVLLFPIAMATATTMEVDPRPFAIAITMAASASFLTPIGYQTNTMVYGPGGYKFTDYVRLGLPLTAAVVVAIIVFVPIFWPF